MKTNSNYIVKFLVIILFLTIPFSVARADDTIDHRMYANLLKKYVLGAKVDYQGFKNQEKELDQYLEVLSSVDADTLDRDEQFAYYINVYNAWTIKLILTKYPDIKSIRDLGSILKSPWKKKFVRIKEKTVTLDHIEHDILRPTFKDPRVHFAVNCASKSCPPLLSEPYTSRDLDRQLLEVTTAFINDPSQYRLEGNTLRVNSIFKWFAEDFNKDPAGFYLQYARGDLKSKLEALGNGIKVKYLDYDWSLNGA
jgi:Protein of unknown function, DUF547